MILTQLAAKHKQTVAMSTVNRGLFPGHEKTDCNLKNWWFAFQKDAARYQIPLVCYLGFKPVSEWTALWQYGTQDKTNAHNYGAALKIGHLEHDALSDHGWQLLGVLGKEVARRRGLDLRWGGDFRTFYPTYWELANWQNTVTKPCDKRCSKGCKSYYELAMPAA